MLYVHEGEITHCMDQVYRNLKSELSLHALTLNRDE